MARILALVGILLLAGTAAFSGLACSHSFGMSPTVPAPSASLTPASTLPPAVTPTKSPTSVQTPTVTDTLTAAPTGTSTPTPTNTPPNSSTPTPAASSTPTASVTPTTTGCSAVGFNLQAPPTASGGTTAVVSGFWGTSKGGYACDQSYAVTLITFGVHTSFSSADQILQTQLWQNGTMVGTFGPSSGGTMTFTGNPVLQTLPGSVGYFSVDYILAPGASGTIDTTISNALGNGSAGFAFVGGIGQLGQGPPDSGPMTVTSSVTSTPTPSPTP
jgi:hypothetical protein